MLYACKPQGCKEYIKHFFVGSGNSYNRLQMMQSGLCLERLEKKNMNGKNETIIQNGKMLYVSLKNINKAG